MEVAEHMFLPNSIYIRNCNRAIESYKGRVQGNYTPGFIGNMLANSMLPNAKGNLSFKMKTFKILDPARNSEPTGISDSFGELIQVLTEFDQFYGKEEKIDLNNIKVETALGKLVKMKLGDALRFNSNHNLRHMNQLERAITQCKSATTLDEVLESL